MVHSCARIVDSCVCVCVCVILFCPIMRRFLSECVAKLTSVGAFIHACIQTYSRRSRTCLRICAWNETHISVYRCAVKSFVCMAQGFLDRHLACQHTWRHISQGCNHNCYSWFLRMILTWFTQNIHGSHTAHSIQERHSSGSSYIFCTVSTQSTHCCTEMYCVFSPARSLSGHERLYSLNTTSR